MCQRHRRGTRVDLGPKQTSKAWGRLHVTMDPKPTSAARARIAWNGIGGAHICYLFCCSALIARETTQTAPIVMTAPDPVAAGLVSSLSRPGGNITGVSMSGPDLAGKRLKLLREFKPGIGTIAFLGYAPALAQQRSFATVKSTLRRSA